MDESIRIDDELYFLTSSQWLVSGKANDDVEVKERKNLMIEWGDRQFKSRETIASIVK